MGRGGRRPGAGRKPKSAQPAAVLVHPSSLSAASLIAAVETPDGLDEESRTFWLIQAPFAREQRTLTKATALAFERYCRVAVMERHASADPHRNPGHYLGLLKQLNAYERQFRLAPDGHAVASPIDAPAPVSKLARFRSPA